MTDTLTEVNKTLGDLIRTMDTPPMDPTTLAEQVIDVIVLSERDSVQRWLMPIVLDEVRRRRRLATLEIEVRVDQELADGVDPCAARKQLIGEHFWTPADGLVPWLTATVEQHAEKAVYQRSRAEPLIVDAERHEAAIAEIEAAGVKCLRDLCRKPRRKAA
jgi:hypothetical protein